MKLGIYWIVEYEVAQQYGGPEEGGWWYDSGVPTKQRRYLGMYFPRFTEESAFKACRKYNGLERERAKQEEDYEYHSVLSYKSQHFSYAEAKGLVAFLTAGPYPERRPHYE